MKQLVVPWAVSLGLLAPLHSLARAGEAAEPEVLSTRVHADSVVALHEQIKAWLAASFGSQDAAGTARTLVDSQGTWGLDQALLPDVVARVLSRQYERGAWEFSLELSPVSDAAAPSRPAVARYRVSLLAPVWVVTGAVRKGDALSCQVLQQDWRPDGGNRAAHAIHANWQGACEALMGSQARRPLQPGDVLKTADIASAAAILGQREAVVVTRQGAIEIQAKGMALADAQVGQRVPVRLNGQDHVVHGVVSAPGVIKVTEGL